jgi:thiol:disulfide interchange protein DsbA
MKNVLVSLMWFCMALPLLASAQEGDKYQAGTHYQVITIPVRTADPEKIEVNEVFWYGCSHCFEFETIMSPWSKNLASDVDFQRTPAIWQPKMEAHARAYYTAKQLNVLESMHPIIFKTMHTDKHPLENEDQIASLFTAHGVDEAAFRKAYNSFTVQSQARQADSRVRGYGVTGTPEIIVNGKYRISARETGGQQGMLDVASFLIEKEREAKSSGKSK